VNRNLIPIIQIIIYKRYNHIVCIHPVNQSKTPVVVSVSVEAAECVVPDVSCCVFDVLIASLSLITVLISVFIVSVFFCILVKYVFKLAILPKWLVKHSDFLFHRDFVIN
jgi:hypothetical protein